MALVGMASKPLHVRRLQKSLQEWVQNPGKRNATNLKIYLMAHPQPHFRLILSFQTNITIFTTNIFEKFPSSIYSSGIRTHNLQNMSLLP